MAARARSERRRLSVVVSWARCAPCRTGFMLKETQGPEYEVTATIALAYVAYVAADHFWFSGIFATASAAFALRGSYPNRLMCRIAITSTRSGSPPPRSERDGVSRDGPAHRHSASDSRTVGRRRSARCDRGVGRRYRTCRSMQALNVDNRLSRRDARCVSARVVDDLESVQSSSTAYSPSFW